MLILTPQDRCVLTSIAQQSSLDGEEGQVLDILEEGFSSYGEDSLIERYESRDQFFRECSGRLLENIEFAGKTFVEVFGLKRGRDSLCRLVGSMGVPSGDVEDVVQEICRKFWKSYWVERYNPLVSSWKNFISKPVQRYVRTYYLRRSKKVMTSAERLDYHDPRYSYPMTAMLYENNAIDTPENNLIIRELIEEWEDFLRVQPPFRDVLDRGFKRLCTMVSPGIPEIPTDGEMTLFLMSVGVYNCRATTQELYKLGISYMIPHNLLVDYISEDPLTGEYLRVEDTGEWVTQKYYPNPDYNPKDEPIRIKRSWLDLYHCLQKELQVEEIARFFKVAPPSIPAWIQKLEGLFRDFWLISDKVPPSLKELAVKTYKCPGCSKLSRKMGDTCGRCGASMRGERGVIRLDVYPWPRAYVRRETYERLGNRRVAMVVQRCSVS